MELLEVDLVVAKGRFAWSLEINAQLVPCQSRRNAFSSSRDVVLAALVRRQAHVTSCLPSHSVAEDLEGPCQLSAGDVPGELQAEISSSRTKCRRMTFGN